MIRMRGAAMKSNRGTRLKFALGVLIMALGLSLVFMAAFFIGNNYHEDAEAGKNAATGLAVLDMARESSPAFLADSSFIPDYQLDPERDMPAIFDDDGRGYVGTLDIPVLDLTLPVQSELSYPNLKISPCKYTGSAYLNTLTIAAHNYTSHFGCLKNLSAGDAVKFTDSDGNEFEYSVVLVSEIAPRPVEQISESGYDLVLFTCTLGGATRVAVFCNSASVEE